MVLEGGLVGWAVWVLVVSMLGGIPAFLLAFALSRLASWAFQTFMVKQAPPPDRSCVIITGCSTGIGRDATLHLAGMGLYVFAGVRKLEDADKFKGNERIIPFVVDVSNESQIRDAAHVIKQRVEKDHLKILGLVNNAGYAEASVMELLPIYKLRKQLDVNVVGQVAMTQAILPLMRKYGTTTLSPRVVFISSGFGKISFPGMGAYCASKYAIEALSDSFRMELQSWNIRVVVVQPGSIKTHFTSNVQSNSKENCFSQEKEKADPVTARYMDKYSRMLGNQVVMEKLFTTTATTNKALQAALLDNVPKTRYQAGLDAEYGVPFILGLPDFVRDRLFGRFFR